MEVFNNPEITHNPDTWGGTGRGFWPHMNGTLYGDGYRCDDVCSMSAIVRAVALPLPAHVHHIHLSCDRKPQLI